MKISERIKTDIVEKEKEDKKRKDRVRKHVLSENVTNGILVTVLPLDIYSEEARPSSQKTCT